jgi:protein MpaA
MARPYHPTSLGASIWIKLVFSPVRLATMGAFTKGSPVVTIELPNASRTPMEAEIRQMWIDLLRWTSERLGPGVTTVAGDLKESAE